MSERAEWVDLRFPRTRGGEKSISQNFLRYLDRLKQMALFFLTAKQPYEFISFFSELLFCYFLLPIISQGLRFTESDHSNIKQNFFR